MSLYYAKRISFHISLEASLYMLFGERIGVFQVYVIVNFESCLNFHVDGNQLLSRMAIM